MALSNKKIKAAKTAGDIIISPFKAEQLATSSYDVTLGEWYFTEQPKKHFRHIYNPWSKSDTDRIWGTEAKRAQKAKDAFKHYKFEFDGIGENDKVIVLEPGETILAHTNEFIGGKHHITTMMKARSSLGRNFIEVCKCAGWGDVGYVNRWTMEITNNSRHYAIPLVVGRRIAQIIFFETGELDESLTSYAKAAKTKYQMGDQNITELKKNWEPSMMIPKLWKDAVND